MAGRQSDLLRPVDVRREDDLPAPVASPDAGPIYRAVMHVRPDGFFGMTYTAAAKAYLEKAKHAVSMDALLEGPNRGGCPVGGKDPKKTLYISLIRAVRDFVPIPGKSGYLGLRKFYANLKSAKEKQAENEPKVKRKKRRKGPRKKKETKTAKADATSKTEKPTSSAKQKSRPAADQTAQKGDTM